MTSQLMRNILTLPGFTNRGNDKMVMNCYVNMKIDPFYHSATETFRVLNRDNIYHYKSEESARKRLLGGI